MTTYSPAVNTYTALSTITLSSSASSVTFSSIPATYRDLVLVSQAKTTGTTNTVLFRFNSDSGSNYSNVYMGGSGSTTNSGAFTDTSISLGVVDVTSMSQNTMQVNDYSATDKHKAALIRTDIAGWGTRAGAGRWASTAAITTVQVSCLGASFAVGSTFSLFGIEA